jgi:tetratricopeptide (TPR) repeat protein
MNYLGLIVLIGWIPFILLAYNTMTPKRAVAILFVAAWLLLPYGEINLPGLPSYNKMTATVLGLLIATMIFNQGMLLSLRPRWFDIPIVVWCLMPMVSSTTNDQGLYAGLAQTLNETVAWGLPYLIGRVCLDDAEAMKDFALAVFIGALVYIPFCLFEMRFSPLIATWVYGFINIEGTRYGGFRPKVFLFHGLELGMWMTNATLMGYSFWKFGTIKQIRGIPIHKLLLALVVTTVLCKSTGALTLLAIAIAAMAMALRLKSRLVLLAIVAIPPLYCATRTLDLWSGQEVVELARATVGEDRAGSFAYRLGMERMLIDRAMERPVFGWFGNGRNLLWYSNGVIKSVPDGWWVIALGMAGTVGLTAMLALLLLPMIVTIRRNPPSTWGDPRVGPLLALSMMLVLGMIDYLSNAMLMPIYPLVAGGLLGQVPLRVVGNEAVEGHAVQSLAMASELVAAGSMDAAQHEFHQAIELASESESDEARRIEAEAYDGLGQTLMAGGHVDDATESFRRALSIRDNLAASSADPERFRDLAIARDGLARALAEAGQVAEAVQERRVALRTWEILSANHPRNIDYRRHLADAMNDLAWVLASGPAAADPDPSATLALAEKAVQISADHDAYWNTLGVARYRAGDKAGAIEALERSAEVSPGGSGTAFDHYVLAMAWADLNRKDLAGEWFERGMAWTARHRPGHPTLEQFRAEAQSMLEGWPDDALT